MTRWSHLNQREAVLRRFKELLLLVATASLTALPWISAAQGGACSFSVSASPENAPEGETITVTVRRTGASTASSVDVESVDGSAKAPEDYDPIPKQTIRFTSESSKTLPVLIKDDAASEPEENFRVRISDPDCGELTVFSIGPPSVVRIQASDPVNPDPVQPADRTTSSNEASVQGSSTSSPRSASPMGTDPEGSPPSSSPTADDPSLDRTLPADVTERGISLWVILAIVVVIISAGVGFWYYKKSASSRSPSGT